MCDVVPKMNSTFLEQVHPKKIAAMMVEKIEIDAQILGSKCNRAE